ncbi:MAG: esterase-like activity of phytase family protein [Novosphingobium sp.]|nr:esterase-like activity of phytase family protein [Novosphingobium sp.]
MRRIAIVLFCAFLLGLVWARSATAPERHDGIVRLVSLDLHAMPAPGKNMQLLAAWQLASDDADFGGYSALAMLGNGRFLALSDRGRQLRFDDPSAGPMRAVMARFAASERQDKFDTDAEAMTRDSVSGTLWAAYEYGNAILRVAADGTSRKVSPRAMADWPENSGPEAMVRLADGRFIVLSESQGGAFGGGGEGLLFPGDPVAGAKPLQFGFQAPDGYRPTDMAALPDGRVMILLRKVVFPVPPRFSSALLLADPATIGANRLWQGKIVARFDSPLPTENYEGLAISADSDDAGAVIVWMISDDNTAVLQRTLLLKLRWKVPARDFSRRHDADTKKGAPPRGTP